MLQSQFEKKISNEGKIIFKGISESFPELMKYMDYQIQKQCFIFDTLYNTKDKDKRRA